MLRIRLERLLFARFALNCADIIILILHKIIIGLILHKIIIGLILHKIIIILKEHLFFTVNYNFFVTL